jgi:hypothetical protein
VVPEEILCEIGEADMSHHLSLWRLGEFRQRWSIFKDAARAQKRESCSALLFLERPDDGLELLYDFAAL